MTVSVTREWDGSRESARLFALCVRERGERLLSADAHSRTGAAHAYVHTNVGEAARGAGVDKSDVGAAGRAEIAKKQEPTTCDLGP